MTDKTILLALDHASVMLFIINQRQSCVHFLSTAVDETLYSPAGGLLTLTHEGAAEGSVQPPYSVLLEVAGLHSPQPTASLTIMKQPAVGAVNL